MEVLWWFRQVAFHGMSPEVAAVSVNAQIDKGQRPRPESLTVICAFCGGYIGERRGGPGVTEGICDRCYQWAIQ